MAGVVVAPKSVESMPNKEALFCVLLAQTAIGLTGVSSAFDGTTIQSLFSYIRPGYIHSGYNRDHGGTTEPERSRNVKLKRTCHPVFVLDLTQNDLLGVG